jgi:hypothetical protein
VQFGIQKSSLEKPMNWNRLNDLDFFHVSAIERRAKSARPLLERVFRAIIRTVMPSSMLDVRSRQAIPLGLT